MSAAENVPPGSPCSECDCPGLDPGLSGAARFCAVCGHAVEAHHAQVATATRPCLDCSCSTFDDGGTTGARFCATCGHATERHPMPPRAAGAPPPSPEYGLRIETPAVEHGLSADREAPALRASEVAPADVPLRVPPPPIPGPAHAARGDENGRRRKLIFLAAVAILAALVAGAAGLALALTGGDSGRPAASDGTRTTTSTTPVPANAVAKVIDGTTFRLGSGQRVKLAQVDAPKVPSKDCYSAEAVAELSRLLPEGTIVVLRRERRLPKVDKYGRRPAYVFVGEQNVSLEMVQAGAAAPYFFFGRRGRFADTLQLAATRAKRDKRGLWGACPKTALDVNHQVHTKP
jgi:micrococcal nuclease